MAGLLDWWRARQEDRARNNACREWRAGYDFAAGHLLRDNQPEAVLRLVDSSPSTFNAGIRCAVRDYHNALARAAQHQRPRAVH